jgi:hypothetical protein
LWPAIIWTGVVGGGFTHPLASPSGRADPDLALAQDVAHDPLAGSGAGEGLTQQGFGLEYLDFPIAHGLAEGVVLALGLSHPQHVVEEEILRIRRGEACVFKTGSVHHDPVELPHLGVDAQ